MFVERTLLIVSSKFLTRFLGWIGLVVLAKLWGGFAPEAIGSIAFAMSFVAMFYVLSDLGFSKAHVKRISEGKELGICMGTYVVAKIFLLLFLVITVFAFIFIFETFYGGTISDATTKSVIYIIVIYHVFLSLQKIIISTLQGTGEIFKRQVVMTFENVIKVPLMVVVAFAGVSSVSYVIIAPINWPYFLEPIKLYISQHTIEILAIAYVSGIVCSCIIGILFLRKYPLKAPNWKMFKSYFVFALPLMMVSTIGTLSINIDKIMIGYFWTSVEVGYYFSMQQITGIILIVAGAIGTVLFPTISKYSERNDFNVIRKIVYKAERYISMMIIPIVVVTIVFAKPIIEIILSSSFLPTYQTLVVLSVYTYVVSIYTVYSSLMLGINKPFISAKIGVFMFLLNILLNYLFIPKTGVLSAFNIYGPTGAAIATLLSIMLGYFLLRFVAKKQTQIKTSNIFIVSHIFSGFITMCILYLVKIWFVNINTYQLVFMSVFAVAVYVLTLYLVNGIDKRDFLFFISLLDPRKMKEHILHELKK